jgi:hypothetical protein
VQSDPALELEDQEHGGHGLARQTRTVDQNVDAGWLKSEGI